VLVLIVAVALLATGCSGSHKVKASNAFCTAVDNYNSEINREIKRGKPDGAKQLALVEKIAQAAPKKIAHDAQAFAAAMRRVVNDPSAKKNRPQDERVTKNVLRFANEACGVYSGGEGI
jgi:hypothetical protein